jgi:hypothetical protein
MTVKLYICIADKTNQSLVTTEVALSRADRVSRPLSVVSQGASLDSGLQNHATVASTRYHF